VGRYIFRTLDENAVHMRLSRLLRHESRGCVACISPPEPKNNHSLSPLIDNASRSRQRFCVRRVTTLHSTKRHQKEKCTIGLNRRTFQQTETSLPRATGNIPFERTRHIILILRSTRFDPFILDITIKSSEKQNFLRTTSRRRPPSFTRCPTPSRSTRRSLTPSAPPPRSLRKFVPVLSSPPLPLRRSDGHISSLR
jgi:hypothetical protein